MGKWTMAYVVQEDGNFNAALLLLGNLMSFLTQGVDCSTHEVHCANGMVEPRVVGTRIYQIS